MPYLPLVRFNRLWLIIFINLPAFYFYIIAIADVLIDSNFEDVKQKSELILLFMSSKSYTILFLLPVVMFICARKTKKVGFFE